MAKTKIEWASHSWNPITGCSKTSEGCRFCYAERMARRLAGRHGYPKAPHYFDVTLRPERLEEPLRRMKPTTYFVCSMGDLFHEDVPDEFILEVWRVMEHCQRHTFLVLTKRPKRMKEFIQRLFSYLEEPDCWELDGSDTWIDLIHKSNTPHYFNPSVILPNVWLGISAENQQRADERIPVLQKIPAAVRLVSLEPLLGPIDLRRTPPVPHEYYVNVTRTGDGTGIKYTEGIDWVICGAETGPGARPMDPDWARALLAQCREAGVPFFMKQVSHGPVPDDLMVREYPAR